MIAGQKLKFRMLAGTFAVLRMAPDAAPPPWTADSEFISITRTRDELSVVCPEQNIPENLRAGPRWICFKLEGPFAFSQTGVLLSFIEPLSNNGIPIFAISTYDTDYVLVEEESAAVTLDTLQRSGHQLLS